MPFTPTPPVQAQMFIDANGRPHKTREAAEKINRQADMEKMIIKAAKNAGAGGLRTDILMGTLENFIEQNPDAVRYLMSVYHPGQPGGGA